MLIIILIIVNIRTIIKMNMQNKTYKTHFLTA